MVPANFYYTLTAGNYNAGLNQGPMLINPIIETFESHNFSSYPWLMGGNKPWVIASGNAYNGYYCSRSGTITHSQFSEMNMSLHISEAGVVSFARRVSSEVNYKTIRV